LQNSLIKIAIETQQTPQAKKCKLPATAPQILGFKKQKSQGSLKKTGTKKTPKVKQQEGAQDVATFNCSQYEEVPLNPQYSNDGMHMKLFIPQSLLEKEAGADGDMMITDSIVNQLPQHYYDPNDSHSNHNSHHYIYQGRPTDNHHPSQLIGEVEEEEDILLGHHHHHPHKPSYAKTLIYEYPDIGDHHSYYDGVNSKYPFKMQPYYINGFSPDPLNNINNEHSDMHYGGIGENITQMGQPLHHHHHHQIEHEEGCHDEWN
jgi:hypothetical protein